MTPHAQPAPRSIDGRTMRGRKTRQKLIVATRLMIIVGHDHPSVIEIAEVAGVSPGSLFNHFTNLEGLYAEALNDQATAALLRRLPVEPHAMALAFMRAA